MTLPAGTVRHPTDHGVLYVLRGDQTIQLAIRTSFDVDISGDGLRKGSLQSAGEELSAGSEGSGRDRRAAAAPSLEPK